MHVEKTVVAYRARGFSPRIVTWLAAGSFVGVIAFLEILCRVGAIGALSFPAPAIPSMKVFTPGGASTSPPPSTRRAGRAAATT